MRWSLLLFAGCASAGPPQSLGEQTDGNRIHPDSTGSHLDAFVNNVDAPPGQHTMTFTQTTNNTNAAGNGIGCSIQQYYTSATNYYRVFDLPALGVTTDFHVTMVSFTVDDCESFGNSVQVAAYVGTYSGPVGGATLNVGSMVQKGNNPSVTVPLTATPGELVNASISGTIPAGSKMFVEVDAPTGNFGDYFFMGVSTGGQSKLGYLSSIDCGTNNPTDIKTLVSGENDLLLSVTGSY